MKWYVLIIFLVTGLSIAGLLVISFNLDPYKVNNQIKYLFFTSLFISLWGVSTLALNRFKTRIDWPDFYESFKIGFVISLVVSLSIFVIRYAR